MTAEGLLLLIVLLVVYLLPAEMAAGRKHGQAGAIFLLNLFLGWTILGWIVALVWAATNPPQTVVVNYPPAPVPIPQPAPPRATEPVAYERVDAIGPDKCPKCWKPREGSLSFCRHCGASYS